MARSSIIKATITGDVKGLKRAFREAETGFDKFKIAAMAGATALTATIAGAAAAAKPLIDAASNLNEASAKAQETFGSAFGDIEQTAKKAAEAFGLSQAEFLDASATLAVFGQTAGLSGKDLSAFSTDLVGAAADLGSFNNIDPEEMLRKLQSGLAGEVEPLRRFGINLSAAQVEAKALEMGLGGLGGELTESEKIMARQALILEQLGPAAGDFARTSGDLANQQRILSAKFEDVQAKLGEKLLPVAIKVAEVALDLIDGFSNLIDVFSEEGLAGVLDRLSERFEWFAKARQTIETFVGYAVGAWQTFGDEITAIVEGWYNYIRTTVETVVGVFQGLVDVIAGVFTGDWGRAWDGVKQIFGSIWDGITGTLTAAWETMKGVTNDAIRNILAWFAGLPAALGHFVGGIAEAIAAPFVAAFGFIKRIWNDTVGGFGFSVPSWIPGVGGKEFRIPEMARGGIVTSPTLALIGEAGPEAVVPLSGPSGSMPNLGGPTTVVVELDGEVLLEAIARADRRSGGTVLGVT